MDDRDDRIPRYKQAIDALKNAEYDITIPVKQADSIGEIGESLLDLAESLRHKFTQEQLMANIIEKVNTGFFLDDVLQHVYNSFSSIIPYNRIGCSLLENNGKIVRACWSASDAGEIHLKSGFSAKLEGSSLKNILQTSQPRILNDLEAYYREHPESDSTRLILKEGIRSSLTCPLVALGNPIGFLFFSSREKNTYQLIHEEVFLRLAGHISMMVEKSRLYQQVVDLNRRLTETQRALEEQATHDALTGLWNRGAIMDLLNKHLALARREEKPLTVILVDVDLFKKVNDDYGHQAGDVVLQSVAKRLARASRAGDFVGRYGGEEFMVVAYPCGPDEAAGLAERLRRQIDEQPVAVAEKAALLDISISGGYCSNALEPDLKTEELVRKADEALYASKSNGRNRITAGT